jgi:hypothetical protein
MAFGATYLESDKPEQWPYDAPTGQKPANHVCDISIDQMAQRIIDRAKTVCLMFWSGRFDFPLKKMVDISVQAEAERIAKLLGCLTLEMLLEEETWKSSRGPPWVMPKWNARDPLAVKIWERASQAIAQGAHTEIHVVLGQRLRETNVWEFKEYPALTEPARVPPVEKIWRYTWDYKFEMRNRATNFIEYEGPDAPTLYVHPAPELPRYPDPPIQKRSLNEVSLLSHRRLVLTTFRLNLTSKDIWRDAQYVSMLRALRDTHLPLLAWRSPRIKPRNAGSPSNAEDWPAIANHSRRCKSRSLLYFNQKLTSISVHRLQSE